MIGRRKVIEFLFSFKVFYIYSCQKRFPKLAPEMFLFLFIKPSLQELHSGSS